MKLTFHGHSCLTWSHAQGAVLFDPFLTGNPLCKEGLESLEATDLLLTHGHEDHVQDAPYIAARPGVRTYAAFEVASWLSATGGNNVIGMNHGGVVQIQGGTARMVNAVHSSVLPDGTHGGNPAGFVVDIHGERLYHAGDTALTMDMELIGRYWPTPIAALPIGGHFTMGWEDALIAAKMVKAREVIAMHYDTFPPIALGEEDKKSAVAAFDAENIKLHFLNPGQQLEIDGRVD
jgi:L-ascorbate metabolism protein UlaG (beta-lactamase superfamily)